MKKKNLQDIFKANPWGVTSEIFNSPQTSLDFKSIIGVDAGGTKTLLGHSEADPKNFLEKEGYFLFEVKGLDKYISDDHPSVGAIIKDYMGKHSLKPEETILSIAGAGPVENSRIRLSNRNWTIDSAQLKKELGLQGVFLLNDLEAMIYAVDFVHEADLTVINRGQKNQQGNIAVIAAGTGLGESIGVWDLNKKNRIAIATEGGFTSFAPSNETEEAFYHYMKTRQDYVCWEDALSGRGLVRIYQFLQEDRFGNGGDNSSKENREVAEQMKNENPAAVISAWGVSGKDPLCTKAVEIFTNIYANETGNLALKCLPYGGVFLAGGITTRILPMLSKPFFMEQFLNKGRLRPVLENIPVYALSNADYGALGAINYAAGKIKESAFFHP